MLVHGASVESMTLSMDDGNSDDPQPVNDNNSSQKKVEENGDDLEMAAPSHSVNMKQQVNKDDSTHNKKSVIGKSGSVESLTLSTDDEDDANAGHIEVKDGEEIKKETDVEDNKKGGVLKKGAGGGHGHVVIKCGVGNSCDWSRHAKCDEHIFTEVPTSFADTCHFERDIKSAKLNRRLLRCTSCRVTCVDGSMIDLSNNVPCKKTFIDFSEDLDISTSNEEQNSLWKCHGDYRGEDISHSLMKHHWVKRREIKV